MSEQLTSKDQLRVLYARPHELHGKVDECVLTNCKRVYDADEVDELLRASLEPGTARGDADYAIEHAEYLAIAASALLDADHQLCVEGSDIDAIDRRTHAARALETRIYEFRKRSDRARASQPPSVTPAYWLLLDDGHVAAWYSYDPREAGIQIGKGELVPLYSKPAQPPLSGAAADVLAERERQKSVEGWTAEHDDEHEGGALAAAAAAYAHNAEWHMRERKSSDQPPSLASGIVYELWPFDEEWWKPKNPRRDLVRAAAMILAEIERIDRHTPTKGADHAAD